MLLQLYLRILVYSGIDYLGDTMRTSLLAMLISAGCATETTSNSATDLENQSGIVELDPRSSLIRLSVDLRGVHPSEEELLAIESNPEYYEEFVDRYLEDTRFNDRMMQIFNLRFFVSAIT